MRMQKRRNIENIQKKSYVSSYFHRVETTRAAKTTVCFFNCYDILIANVQNTCKIYAVRTYSCSIIRFVFYGGMMDSFNLNKKKEATIFNGIRDKYIQKSSRFFCSFANMQMESILKMKLQWMKSYESLTFTLHPEKLQRRDYFKVNEMHCALAPPTHMKKSKHAKCEWLLRNRKF